MAPKLKAGPAGLYFAIFPTSRNAGRDKGGTRNRDGGIRRDCRELGPGIGPGMSYG